MRVKGTTIQQVLLGLALLAGVIWNVARADEGPAAQEPAAQKPADQMQTSQIRALRLSAGPTGTRVDIRLDRKTDFQVLSLSGPDRLVVDLPDTAIGADVAMPEGKGLVKAVRSGKPVPGATRIVFDLASAVVALKPRFEQGDDGPHLVLEWPDDGVATAQATKPADRDADAPAPKPQAPAVDPAFASSQATSRLIASLPTAAPAPPKRTDQTQTPVVRQGSGTIATGVPTRVATGAPASAAARSLTTTAPTRTVSTRTVSTPTTPTPTAPTAATAPVRTMREVTRRGGLRPLVIAVDAGHGGQDPGAIGAGGTREKDLTLQIAKELARQVNATPGLKAYLTRDADYFIPLAQRYQKARSQKADLFVSIHADAFTNPAASGSSVFVLSQRGASSQAAKWLAKQENAADLVGGVRLQGKDNTLASVLLDLSQSATMKASEDMANHVLSGLKRLGKTHKPQVERANFVVLRAPDVPSMLVETAFITNPQEERRLRDRAHQSRLASAILQGVNSYFTRQPPPGTLYAARAETGASGGGGSP